MFKIKIRQVKIGYETLNETNGELSFFDTIDDIAQYAKQENLEVEFGDWSDDEEEE